MDDIKYSGIPNVCFSLTGKDDDREPAYAKQRKEHGFDESETWSLTNTIAKFIIPRLELYLEIAPKVLEENKEYTDKVNTFLEAMKLIDRDSGTLIFSDKEQETVSNGLAAFPEIFLGLWW